MDFFLKTFVNKTEGTGEHTNASSAYNPTGDIEKPIYQIVKYPLGDYIVDVMLAPNDIFLGIKGISINKVFYSSTDVNVIDISDFEKCFEENNK